MVRASRWRPEHAPAQSGRVALVTGATGGLGREVCRQLAERGATVVLAARDAAKRAETASWMRGQVPTAHVESVELDLSDLGSVEAAAHDTAERVDRVDVLVNNAGVMATPYRRTAEGFELQFGINHLGHFALTGHLLPLLLSAGAPRVVNVSSTAHRMGRLDLDDLDSEHRYRKWRAYGRSKLANLLFTQELQRRADAAGVHLTSVAAHPGYAATGLQTVGPRMQGSRLRTALMRLVNRLGAQHPAQGAWPIVYAATMPDVDGGDYFGPDGPGESRGHPTRVGMSREACDRETARRLWDESTARTGAAFPALVG
ncbi:SDR family NAD(P)-dependent oxidoreductase [Egibacter rhizosphaerae]|uniref:SDR family NAD(P)-dependent oxidoreductase n=1 Tax=Egibacter rhizosphaerae TaxID=1670831 RepID=A0A411YBZ1_9ACTN|nr:oxidoreductase [Egibacter rhizosphaerae]QBI18751.1 SDR family NAD(P)-dependent oxidoreductase [Egibacter rhizosphaerae]